jgi:LSD1 subclass zinc finger protein
VTAAYPQGNLRMEYIPIKVYGHWYLDGILTKEKILGGGMDQIVCGGCRTPLMYNRGATSVRCIRCQTVTSVTGIIIHKVKLFDFFLLFCFTQRISHRSIRMLMELLNSNKSVNFQVWKQLPRST